MQKTLSVINLAAVRANALYLKGLLGGKKLFAVVKADAYGHGAERVSREIEDVVYGFCVAIAEEGAALRISGITKPILVFAPPGDAADAETMRAYALTATVNNRETAKLCAGLDCHIKVNTGMNRYGCEISELGGVLSALEARQVSGVYSHLYAAEDTEASLNQLQIFNRTERTVKDINPQAISHISASGGLLRGGEFIKDGARCGIALYGYAPEGFECAALKPALKVYAPRMQTARFIGGGVGYGKAARGYGELSTYRCGYADGFFRGAPLGENKLCMDAFISQNDDDMLCVFNDAKEYARRCNTISYEVLCSVTRRSERVYEK